MSDELKTRAVCHACASQPRAWLCPVCDNELAALKAGQGEAVYLVPVTGSLDEIDAPVWPFINEEARKVGAENGRIETYKYERANGGVAVLWDANRLHAMAVTIRDDMNRTRCIRMLTAPPATGVTDPGWRCFQCDEHFTDADSAGLHFGTHQHQSPACLIDVAEYRAMEARMHAYNEEDAEIHRAMARMHGQHRTALQREEEKGYARALKDTGYDASADAVPVPRELLGRLVDMLVNPIHYNPSAIDKRAEELHALLAQSQGVKP